jgi:hypothetical protein
LMVPLCRDLVLPGPVANAPSFGGSKACGERAEQQRGVNQRANCAAACGAEDGGKGPGEIAMRLMGVDTDPFGAKRPAR